MSHQVRLGKSEGKNVPIYVFCLLTNKLKHSTKNVSKDKLWKTSR